MCFVCNLDFKNPTDIIDVVEHAYLQKVESGLKRYQERKCGPNIKDLVISIKNRKKADIQRSEESGNDSQLAGERKSVADSNLVFFESIKKSVDRLGSRVVELEEGVFGKRVKELAKELGVEEGVVGEFFVNRKANTP